MHKSNSTTLKPASIAAEILSYVLSGYPINPLCAPITCTLCNNVHPLSCVSITAIPSSVHEDICKRTAIRRNKEPTFLSILILLMNIFV